MVALVASTLVTIFMTWAMLAYGKRRPVGTPVTWGEAMIGSVWVFFLAFMAYGIVPHQWLTLAENEWSFRADRILQLGGLVTPQSQGGWFPVDITYRAISDIVATLFYGVFIVGQVVLHSLWQNRTQRSDAKEKAALEARSSFGRPLIKQG